MLQKVTAGLQAGNYPDIAYIYGSDLANLARGERAPPTSSEAVEKRRNRMGQLPSRRPRKRRPSKANRGRCRPFVDNLAVVYNTKIFEEAGVPFPTDEWTWEEFLETAAKLNNKEQGDRRLRLAGHR